MAFQQSTQSTAGGILYDDGLEFLFGKAPITSGHVHDSTNYLPQQSSTGFPFRQDNASVRSHMHSEVAPMHLPSAPAAGELQMRAEFAAPLEEIKQAVASLHTRIDQTESLF